MAVIATAELTIDVPLPVAFQHFTDYSSWDLWMPPLFRPITGPSRQLRTGDTVKVNLGEAGRRVRTELNVIRVRPNRELCWRAGIPGVLVGEHSFFFSEQAGGTALRSEEPFSGVFAHAPLSSVIERSASRLHSQMLSGFAAHVRGLR